MFAYLLDDRGITEDRIPFLRDKGDVRVFPKGSFGFSHTCWIFALSSSFERTNFRSNESASGKIALGASDSLRNIPSWAVAKRGCARLATKHTARNVFASAFIVRSQKSIRKVRRSGSIHRHGREGSWLHWKDSCLDWCGCIHKQAAGRRGEPGGR
jgi:hypothetical protein